MPYAVEHKKERIIRLEETSLFLHKKDTDANLATISESEEFQTNTHHQDQKIQSSH